jgi:DNA-binding NarL/FixJ family response regulator
MVGRRPLNDTIELDGFHWFLGYWASGSAEGARGLLEEVEADANTGRNAGGWVSELVEMAWALLALQEARWRDAADLVELILEGAPPDDPYGAAPLLQAVLALALAALGERDGAIAALERARKDRRGVSQALAGFRRRIIVQVLQWLHYGDPGAEAIELAEWAREQGLPLIELEALHLAAVESRKLARAVRPRVRELAESIDPIVSEVIAAHIEKVAAGASPTDVSEPEVRLLSELGLWAPLPESTALSAREREIALLAALGYSSRFIAERFHLSTRTVETHLAHVYAKLGIADRDELRRWFSVDRRAA